MMAFEPHVLVLAGEAAETEQKENDDQNRETEEKQRERERERACTPVLQMERELDNRFKRMWGGDENDSAFYS